MTTRDPRRPSGTAYHAEVHETRGAAEAAFIIPYLSQGMALLDCGCGPGMITLELAKIVAPGEVVGIDIEERRISQARENAAKQGITNVRFDIASVYELPFPDESFDAAFEHTMLQHLNDPTAAVKEIRRVLRPGGVFGARDMARNGQLIYGIDASIIAETDAFMLKWSRYLGADSAIGERLREILTEAGFEDVMLKAAYESRGTPDLVKQTATAWLRYFSDPELRATAVERGWADETTFQRWEDAIRAWSDAPGAFQAHARGEAVGWKPSSGPA